MCSAIDTKHKHISTHDLARRSTLAVSSRILIWVYFNSRPRKEVDRLDFQTDCRTNISTHDLARRSTVVKYLLSYYISFQLTTSQGGRRLADIVIDSLPIVFQLTTSQGGRLLLHQVSDGCTYFNSRPRKEVDVSKNEQDIASIISTHDLARRSTSY